MLRHSSSLKKSSSSPSLWGEHYPDSPSEGITKHSLIAHDTTLFRTVPYDGVDKDEKAYVDKVIKHHKFRDPNFEEITLSLDYLKLTGFNTGKEDIKAGPVVELNYITICNDEILDVHFWDDYKLYGTVSGIDYAGNTVFLYNRAKDDPEAQLSPSDHELSLTACPIVPMRCNGLKFDLFDTHGKEIFATTTYVDYKFRDNCEDDDLVVVYGNNGFYAKMSCFVIPFAIITEVTVKLIGPYVETLDVQGEIVVNDYSFLKENSFKLVRERGNESVFRAEQSRTALALPAYSLLYVEIDLSSHGTDFCKGVRTHQPGGDPTRTLYIDCKDDYSICVGVDWIHPDKFFGIVPPEIPGALGDYYVEVFSIFVGGGDSTLLALSGSIVVQDKKETAYIFSRNFRCPDNLMSNEFRRIISLAWPSDRWILEKDFLMHFKLKDAKNRSICRGSLSWNDDCDWYPKRFDKRMCAVIPGKDGYFVAVHYSIFRDGLRAKVTVTVECESPCDHFDVYGSVCAQYNNCDYRSAYDKEYYQIYFQ